jgi:uncharacterized protein YraI
MPKPQLRHTHRCCERSRTGYNNIEQHTDDPVIQGKYIKENSAGASETPAFIHDVIRSPGQPLDKTTRSFFEPRFGYNFSKVRIHTDTRANTAARSVQSRAFTFGNHIVFGAREYAPQQFEGKRTLSHELAHTVQQTENRPNNPFIQRRILVNSGMRDILDYLNTLCPANWGNSGKSITGNAPTGNAQSCTCLEDTVNDPNRTYSINVNPVQVSLEEEKLYDGTKEDIPKLSTGPHTLPGANPIINMHSSGSPVEFGSFDPGGNAERTENWRIFAHELCGHARLNQGYTGVKGNRPEHDSTINTENQIAAEHGRPPRGLFNSRRQGESYHCQPSDNRLVFKLVDGWHYEETTAVQNPPITTGTRNGTVTASSLRIRQGPSTSTPVVGTYSRGTTIPIECQTPGTSVAGNSLWHRTDLGYVSARYVNLPSRSSTKLPTCNPMPTPSTGVIYGRVSTASSELRIRQAPSTSSAVVGSYNRGEMIAIICQTQGTEVLGSTIWNQTDRGYVSDRYIERLPPNASVPRCTP